MPYQNDWTAGSKSAALRIFAARSSLTSAINSRKLLQNIVQRALEYAHAFQVDRLALDFIKKLVHICPYGGRYGFKRGGIYNAVESKHILPMLVDVTAVDSLAGIPALSEIEPGTGFQRDQMLWPNHGNAVNGPDTGFDKSVVIVLEKNRRNACYSIIKGNWSEMYTLYRLKPRRSQAEPPISAYR
jgi:hypothetical protein